jgi:hypothetical protein
MYWVTEKWWRNSTAATITSDAGGLILREVEHRTGIVKKFAECFVDYRKPEAIEHSVEDLVAQRIYGLCLGYEDLNDHDELGTDPLLAVTLRLSPGKARGFRVVSRSKRLDGVANAAPVYWGHRNGGCQYSSFI